MVIAIGNFWHGYLSLWNTLKKQQVMKCVSLEGEKSKKKRQGINIRKEEVDFPIYRWHDIVYVENPQESPEIYEN